LVSKINVVAYFSGNELFYGMGLTPELRFYPAGEALNGFFAAPFLRFQTCDGEGYIGFGAVIGRQWIYGETVSMEFFIGPSLNEGFFFGEIGIRGGLNIGISF
jgi:hypothetical protein